MGFTISSFGWLSKSLNRNQTGDIGGDTIHGHNLDFSRVVAKTVLS